jgi:TRAP-type mannitol/chloroaromatic compound transport system substrate-binding protein
MSGSLGRTGRSLIAAAVIGGLGMGLAATDAAAQERVRWRVPIAFPSTLPSLGDNMQWVADMLEMASGGNIQLRIAEPGELVPALELTEAVGQGQVEAGYNWVGYDQGRIPSSPLFSAVPFGLEPWEYAAWWYYGGGRELGEDIYGANNVHPIFCGITSPETAGWFREPIESLDDLQGLRIRFAGLGGRVMQALGANVTMIPGGEVFQSLERGAIDAAEFSLPAVDQLLGFGQVAPYNYFPGWHQQFTALHLVVNLDTWNALDEQTQAMFNMACQAGVMNSLSKSEAGQGAIIRDFPDNGITALILPEPILRELYAVTQQVLDEEAARDEDFARVLESQRAFTEDYDYWKQYGYLPRDFVSEVPVPGQTDAGESDGDDGGQ